jgi:hypothetical protein
MNVKAISIVSKSIIPEETEFRMDLLCSCIVIRIKYEYMLASYISLLLTLYASRIDNAFALIKMIYEPRGILKGT